ncbi:hypothetical protein AIIKEEIJ_01733 [Rhodococcus sp. YH1]|nr:hypothetical protein [Rhodococcus sp. YH1]
MPLTSRGSSQCRSSTSWSRSGDDQFVARRYVFVSRTRGTRVWTYGRAGFLSSGRGRSTTVFCRPSSTPNRTGGRSRTSSAPSPSRIRSRRRVSRPKPRSRPWPAPGPGNGSPGRSTTAAAASWPASPPGPAHRQDRRGAQLRAAHRLPRHPDRGWPLRRGDRPHRRERFLNRENARPLAVRGQTVPSGPQDNGAGRRVRHPVRGYGTLSGMTSVGSRCGTAVRR